MNLCLIYISVNSVCKFENLNGVGKIWAQSVITVYILSPPLQAGPGTIQGVTLPCVGMPLKSYIHASPFIIIFLYYYYFLQSKLCHLSNMSFSQVLVWCHCLFKNTAVSISWSFFISKHLELMTVRDGMTACALHCGVSL